MLESLPPPIDHFPSFLARLPSPIELEALARSSKAFRRARGVRSGTDLLRLALAWGPGGYSLQRVAAWAGERDIARLTEDALIQRLHAAGAFLEEFDPAVAGPRGSHAVLAWAGSARLGRHCSERTGERRHGLAGAWCV